MRKFYAIMIMLMLMLPLTGCGGGGGNGSTESGVSGGQGAVAFNLDLKKVLAGSEGSAATTSAYVPPQPTSAIVTITRDGFDTIVQELTIVDNTASGRIDALQAGYWHVLLEIYENDTLLVTSETDVNVVAGVEVECVLYIDPVSDGAVTIRIDVNPLPGHQIIPQACDIVMFDDFLSLYILDRQNGVIGVYDSLTLDFLYSNKPPMNVSKMVFNFDKTMILLASNTGNVYQLDMFNHEYQLVFESDLIIDSILPVSSGAVVIWGMASDLSEGRLISFDPLTGMELDSRSGISFAGC
ncbi:MAG: hypothetical protein HKM93_21575, partial [Desulfobacteraceae bacterium]|nr:hypothetical protein [Desulfobacteraceae bacterium]